MSRGSATAAAVLTAISPRVAELNARIAAYPIVAELRQEHAIALVQPMVGCPWVGEPRVDVPPLAEVELPTLPSWWEWEVGAYAAALLRKREPAFAVGDLSHLRTRFEPPATVIFVTDVRCRRSKRRPDGRMTIAIAEILLPAHALIRVPRAFRALPAPPGPPARPLPREVPRLASPRPKRSQENSKMSSDNPSSRKRSGVADVGQGGRT